jgi:hypothetical protein
MSSDGAIKSNRPPGGHPDKGGGRNLIVEFGAALPDGDPLTTNALPGGFPFLIDDDTEEVVEPALLFLVDAYLTKTGFWNRNTTKRAAVRSSGLVAVFGPPGPTLGSGGWCRSGRIPRFHDWRNQPENS